MSDLQVLCLPSKFYDSASMSRQQSRPVVKGIDANAGPVFLLCFGGHVRDRGALDGKDLHVNGHRFCIYLDACIT